MTRVVKSADVLYGVARADGTLELALRITKEAEE